MVKSIQNLIVVALMFCCLPLAAKVDSQSKQHFVIKQELVVKKPLSAVFQQFKQVDKWWEGDHSVSGDATNLYFDFDKGRCFCEQMPNGGFIEHLQVIHVVEQKKVVFSGGLGPLQDHPVNGKLIWLFEEQDGQVKVSVEYRVHGFVVGGMEKWPEAVDYVLGVQVKRLKTLLE